MKTDYILVSSMYPSGGNTRYGIFVRNAEQLLAERGVHVIGRAVITANEVSGRVSGLKKVLRYSSFYLSVLRQLFCHPRVALYVHFPNTLLYLLAVCRWFGCRPRLILNFHGSDINSVTDRQEAQYRLLRDQVASYVVPSNFLRSVVMNRLSVPKEAVFVSPSGGVDLNRFTILEKHANVYDFIFVSRIHDMKGWATALEAVKLLSRDMSIRALFVGSGVHQDKLEAATQGLANVQWQPGVDQSALPDVYRLGKWLLFPSHYEESLALVPLESMAVGTPVIASNIGAPGDYIEDGVNGLSCTPSVIELEAAMRRSMALSGEEYVSIRDCARDTAVRFSADVTGDELALHIKRVLI